MSVPTHLGVGRIKFSRVFTGLEHALSKSLVLSLHSPAGGEGGTRLQLQSGTCSGNSGQGSGALDSSTHSSTWPLLKQPPPRNAEVSLFMEKLRISVIRVREFIPDFITKSLYLKPVDHL